MVRKIGFLVICILFIVLGILGVSDLYMLSWLVKPFTLLGDFLRFMSTRGTILNAFAVVLYLSISLSPLSILFYKIRHKQADKYDYWFYPLFGVILGVTLYLFINPHILYQSLHPLFREDQLYDSVEVLELLITSGIAYVFYGTVLLYILIKIYMKESFSSIALIKVILDVVIVTIAFSILTMSLSNLTSSLNETSLTYEKILLLYGFISDFVIGALLVYLVLILRWFILNLDEYGFNVRSLVFLRQLQKTSFLLLILTIGLQMIKNLYQLIVLEKLMTIEFTFDLPLSILFITALVYVLSKYIAKAIEIKQENELFI